MAELSLNIYCTVILWSFRISYFLLLSVVLLNLIQSNLKLVHLLTSSEFCA